MQLQFALSHTSAPSPPAHRDLCTLSHGATGMPISCAHHKHGAQWPPQRTRPENHRVQYMYTCWLHPITLSRIGSASPLWLIDGTQSWCDHWSCPQRVVTESTVGIVAEHGTGCAREPHWSLNVIHMHTGILCPRFCCWDICGSAAPCELLVSSGTCILHLRMATKVMTRIHGIRFTIAKDCEHIRATFQQEHRGARD